MSAGFIAFIVALGSSVWVYSKLQNRTGYGNNKAAVQAAIAVFVLGVIILFTLLHLILPN